MTLVKAQDEGVAAKSTKAKPLSASKRVEFSRADRVSLFLELADCYRMDGRNADAAKVMEEAMSKYQGTQDEIRLTVANADLAMEKGDVESAINILKTVRRSD